MSGDAVIERATSPDGAEALYRHIYPHGRTGKFDWLYKQNPCGGADMYHAVEPNGGEVVGAYSIMPMKFWWHGEMIDVGQAIDALVLPAFRRKGLFGHFLQFSANDVKDKYRFLIAFPNPFSQNTFLKSGWIHIGDLETFFLPLTGRSLADRFSIPGAAQEVLGTLLSVPVSAYRRFHTSRVDASGITIQPFQQCSPEIESVAALVQSCNPVTTARTAEFVTWRMLQAPVDDYLCYRFETGTGLTGYGVIRRAGNAAELVDLFVDPAQAPAALKALIQECLTQGFNLLRFQVAPGSYCIQAMKRLGARQRPAKTPVMIYPLSLEPGAVEYANWFLTHADTDWV